MALSHGNAQNARQLMDKETLISSLLVIMVILSMWMGYIMGIKNG
jgi:hypothetical protein